jgi:nucleoside 2-deoxyribosyltransferase
MINSVYLAGSLNAKVYLQDFKDILLYAGIRVTSRWLEFDPLKFITKEDAFEAAAKQDYEDLAEADLVVLFTDVLSTQGGVHFEYGLACGLAKQIVFIGRTFPNVFYYLPKGRWYKDRELFLIDLLQDNLIEA